MIIDKLTNQSLINLIKEQIPKKEVESFLNRIICKHNIKHYSAFFKFFAESKFGLDTDSLEMINKWNEYFYVLSIFLIYNEVLTPVSILPLLSTLAGRTRIEVLSLAELHAFNPTNSNAIKLPYKSFVRDTMVNIYHSNVELNSYKDIDNVNQELLKCKTASGTNAPNDYLVRINNQLASCETEIFAANKSYNISRNEDGTKHYKYLDTINLATLKKLDFYGNPILFTFKTSDLPPQSTIFSNIYLFAKNILDRTINYKI